jgi:hypothetical protein
MGNRLPSRSLSKDNIALILIQQASQGPAVCLLYLVIML